MNHILVTAKINRLVLLVAMLMVLPARVMSKSVNVDSLLKVAAAMPDDTAHFGRLLLISNELRSADPEASLGVCMRVLKIAQTAKNDELLGIAYTTMGNVLRVQSRYTEAIETLTHAYTAFQNIGDLEKVVQTDLNIASIYLTQQNNAQAKKYLLDALPFVEQKDLKGNKGTLYMNLAIVYTAEKAYDQATDLYQKCLDLYTAEGSQRDLALTYANLGDVNLQKGDYRASIDYSQKAYDEFDRLGYRYEQTIILLNIIDAQSRLKDFASAATRVDDLIRLAAGTGSAEVRAMAWSTASAVHEGLGQHRLALEEFKTFYHIHDSLYSEDQKNKLSAIESQIAVTKRDAEISSMKSQKQLDDERTQATAWRFWALAIGLGICIVFVILLILSLRTRSKINRALHENNRLVEAHNQAIAAQNEALRQQNERLEDLNREKDGLIGIVAHDLKSPLNKAGGLADLIASTGPLTPAQAQAVEMLRKVATTGNDLIRDLLDLNAIEHADSGIRLQAIDLSRFLAELRQEFEGTAQRKAIQVHSDCPAALELVTDRSDLGRILENLLSNAIKFSPKGKQIWLRAESADSHVRITVEDQGPGISPEDQQKLFKKFQRLSARPTGGESSTGLGLAITMTLVRNLGGDIQVESSLGEGSRFTVVLPLKVMA
jgi:signal transduction histidine kinase